MRTLIFSLALGVAMSGAALITGCDRTIHEDTRTSTSTDGTQRTKTTEVKEKPDGTIVKEERRTTNTDNP